MRRVLQPNAMRKETFENIFTSDLTMVPFVLKEGSPNFSFNCYQAREEHAKARRKAKHCQGFSFLYLVIAALSVITRTLAKSFEYQRIRQDAVKEVKD